MSIVTVDHVNIPPWSTIGFCDGVNEEGERVRFATDHRPARHIGEAVEAAESRDDLPVVEVEDWQWV